MNFSNMKNKSSENGFVLVALLLGIAILALLYFGTQNDKGEAEQAIQAKKQAVQTVNEVNDKVKEMNARINKNLEEASSTKK